MKPLEQIKELEKEISQLDKQVKETKEKKNKLIKTLISSEEHPVIDRFRLWDKYKEEKIHDYLPSAHSRYPLLREFMDRSNDMDAIRDNRRGTFDLFEPDCGGNIGVILWEVLEPEEAAEYYKRFEGRVPKHSWDYNPEPKLPKYFGDDQEGLDALLTEIMTTGITGFIIDW